MVRQSVHADRPDERGLQVRGQLSHVCSDALETPRQASRRAGFSRGGLCWLLFSSASARGFGAVFKYAPAPFAAGALALLQRAGLRAVLGRGFVERGDQQLRRAGNAPLAFKHDLARGDLLSVDALVGAVILAKR